MPLKRFSCCLAVALCFGSLLAFACRGLAADSLGRVVADFELRDQDGAPHRLRDYADKSVVVVVFLGVECPLAKTYAPRLDELAKQYRSRGVALLAIDSNQQDSTTELAAFARQLKLSYPLLKDPGNRVADQFAAERTPQAFVLDRRQTIRYQGRIDDQYGIGYQRPEPTRRDVAEAIDDLLAGRDVRVASTSALGCLIGRVRQPQTDAAVTYHGQIAELFQNRCVTCHRPGEIGPMELTRYDDVAGWSAMIGEVVAEGRMPPWHANPSHGTFANDTRLSDQERQLVADWVAAGAPEGTPPASAGKARADAEWSWRMGTPDLVVPVSPRPYAVPAKGVLDYRYFSVDPKITEDRWVSAIEFRAGNAAVVHHILAFVRGPKERFANAFGLTGYFGCMVPGAGPEVFPTGMAKLIPAGSKLIFQVHYTPTGTPQQDQSQMALKFVDPKQIEYEVHTGAVGNILMAIPPHAPDHRVLSSRPIRRESLLLSMFPHMHLRGKAFRYLARYPDGTEEILLDVPRYDFNWQHNYLLAQPKRLPPGTQLRCEAVYDNSTDNPANPAPDEWVGFGEQTFEEMMLGYYAVAVPRRERPGAVSLNKRR